MKRLNLEPLESREVPAAKLQIIHNSPFAAVNQVDVYVNGNLFLDNLPFQSATEYLTLASKTDLTIAITPATSKEPLASAKLNLEDGSSTVAVILGEPANTMKIVTAPGRLTAANPNMVELLTLNGAPDLVSLDINVRGVGPVGDDLAFGIFSATYMPVSALDRHAEATFGQGGIALASAELALANSAGRSAVLMTSGFADPRTAGDSKLALIAVFDDGTSVTFANSPNRDYAVAAATDRGGAVVVASANGTAVQTIIAYPGSTSSPRIATADLNDDGVPDLIIGSGAGVVGTVRILDGATSTMIREFEPFGMFGGGINVAAGDLTGDGVPDYVISPDTGGGPRVRVYNGATGEQIADYFGIDDVNFRGGARAAIGDLNADGRGDLIVAAGLGGGPRIALFNGAELGMNGGPKFAGDFFAFESELRNGAFVTAGDVNGDGFDDLIVGGGPGGGPRVRVMDGKFLSAEVHTMNTLADFFAGDVDERRGARVSARDLDGDGKADIITGGIPSSSAVARIFLATELPLSGIATPAATLKSLDGLTATDEVYVG